MQHVLKMPSKRSAFVTGGGGYIGSRLAKRLAENGYRVTTFDVHYFEEDNGGVINRIRVLKKGDL